MTLSPTLTRLLALACVSAAALVAMTAADAQDAGAPKMRRDAIVDGAIVTLGDLVEGCSRFCDAQLFQAPAPGQTGTIQTARVLAAARETGLMNIDASGATHVKVTRTGRQATREDIDAALAQAIGARTSIDAGDLSVMIDQQNVKLSLAASGHDSPSVTDLIIDTRARRFSASLVTPQSRGSSPARVSGAYVETVAVPILLRPLQRGDAIRAEDIAVERRDRESVGADIPITQAAAVGRVARSALRAGAILRDNDLTKQLLVDRNMPVTMVLQSGSLQLMMKGKAVDQGAMGDLITVLNLNSKRTVQGVVTGPGTVRVDGVSPAPARTAAAQ